jgi:plasma kallikrein
MPITIVDTNLQIEIPTPPPDMENKSTCGHRNANGVAELQTSAGEGKSEFGEFPWMVMILEETIWGGRNQSIYQCGGSL